MEIELSQNSQHIVGLENAFDFDNDVQYPHVETSRLQLNINRKTHKALKTTKRITTVL